jgi:hypothetical protein
LTDDRVTKQPVGICGFKAGNLYTDYKTKEYPDPEGGGLRKSDNRTQLSPASYILLKPDFKHLRIKVIDVLTAYAFANEPKIVGIDFGVQDTNKEILNYMREKGYPYAPPPTSGESAGQMPYVVKRGNRPEILLHVFRCDRDLYETQNK